MATAATVGPAHQAPGRARADTWLGATILAVVLAGGAVLRFVGIRWGTPTWLHPDESVIVNGVMDMVQRHSFEPASFARPDHVEMQLGYLAYEAYAHLVHHVSPEAIFVTDKTPFLLLSRAITAAFGTASIVVAYLIGRRFSRGSALVAAFLVAFFPLYVEHSHYATPDVPLTFFFLCVILACIRYVERPGWRPLLLAAFAVAASTAVKYPGLFGCLVIAAVVVAAAVRDRAWLRLVAHGLSALVGVVVLLFVISPALFTNIHTVLAQLRAQAAPGHLGADGLDWKGTLWFYVVDGAGAAGVVVIALAVVGVVWVVRHRLLRAVPLFAGVAYWVLLSAVPLHWSRWGLPMYASPLLLAAVGLPVVVRRVRLVDPIVVRRVAVPAVAVVLSVAGAALVVSAVAETATLTATDTRVAGVASLERAGVDATNSVFEGYTPMSPTGPGTVFDDFTSVSGRLEPRPLPDGGLPRFIVLSSDMGDRYEAEARYVSEQAFYREVEQGMPLAVAVAPVPKPRWSVLVVPTLVDGARYLHGLAVGGYSGPTIRAFEITDGRTSG